MIATRQATDTSEIEDVRGLMRGFLAWHRARHVEDIALIEAYFDGGDWEHELATLPGKYAPPRGEAMTPSSPPPFRDDPRCA